MSLDSQKVDTVNLSRAFPTVFPSPAEIQSVIQLAGDVSTRRYFRIHAENESFVLQAADSFADDIEKSHSFLSMLKLLEEWKIPVPKLRGVQGNLGWILLEDLGDKTLHATPTLALYRQSIDSIIDWTIQSLKTPAQTQHFAQAFDFEKLNNEMKYTAEHLIDGLLGGGGEEYLLLTSPNSRYLEARPRVLCHRDYHSKNLMLFQDRAYVIDFQDARMGPVTYDIASLLWDPYVRLSESWKIELLKYWHEQLLRRGSGLSQIENVLKNGVDWKTELERMKVQRLLKACGSYAGFFRNRGRKDYLSCIRPTVSEICRSIAQLKALGSAVREDEKLLAFLESRDWSPVDILVNNE